MDREVLEYDVCEKGGIEITPVRVAEKKKKGFEEAATEYKALPADDFFDALDERIKRRFNA
jgi:hypothetical protein